MRQARRRQAGITLVELMVTAGLVALMVGLTFTMLVQLSTAYRGQGRIAELQQALVATEAVLVRDVRQAGYLAPNGMKWAADGRFHQAIEITDASTGPDQLTVAYADATAQARVVSFAADHSALTVDAPDHFSDGDLALLSDSRDPPANVSPAPPQAYDACVVRVTQVNGTSFSLDTAAPWGAANNPQCSAVYAANAQPAADTMIYRLALHAYRIDADRPELGVLQRSETGGVEDDWEDLGVGYTDLQIASRWVDSGGVKTWESSGGQDALGAPSLLEPTTVPIQLTVSVVVRSPQRIEGVTSDRTPSLTVAGNTDHNEVGDRAAVQLAGVADSSRPDELRGDHVYRWTTFRVDLRNLGVGR